MNKRIKLDELGGFPVTQDALAFMQDSYRGAFAAIAKLCGTKTILYGVEVIAGNVTPGWIAYEGELIPFTGGAVGAAVVITEAAAPLQALFADGSSKDVYFTKVATVGVTGTFPFSELVPLLSLQHVWRPGDIKERYCDAAYIAANFDVDGYGLGVEKGWRILTKALPATAGRVMVTLDTTNAKFDEVGKVAGAEDHTLTEAQMPAHTHTFDLKENGTFSSVNFPAVTDNQSIGFGKATTDSKGGGGAHNNLQPSYTILKLIKL